MRAVFVEAPGFTEWITEYMTDDDYSAIQHQLMKQPDAGAVMPACGGLRKLRIADPSRQKGRRGGARIIYLYIPEARRFYLIDVYGKHEKSDLSAEDKQLMRHIAAQIRQVLRTR